MNAITTDYVGPVYFFNAILALMLRMEIAKWNPDNPDKRPMWALDENGDRIDGGSFGFANRSNVVPFSKDAKNPEVRLALSLVAREAGVPVIGAEVLSTDGWVLVEASLTGETIGRGRSFISAIPTIEEVVTAPRVSDTHPNIGKLVEFSSDGHWMPLSEVKEILADHGVDHSIRAIRRFIETEGRTDVWTTSQRTPDGLGGFHHHALVPLRVINHDDSFGLEPDDDLDEHDPMEYNAGRPDPY